jgi:hypothetical protein
MKETIFKVLVKASNLNHGVAKKSKLHRRKSSTYLISFLSIESSTSLKDISYTYHLFPKISVLVRQRFLNPFRMVFHENLNF